MYEVKTKEWPFPHTMEWTEKGWCLRDTKTTPSTKVTEWRGLNSDPAEVKDDVSEADLAELESKLKEILDERFA